MEQNIRTLFQIPQSPPNFHQFLTQLPKDNEETKNELDRVDGTLLKSFKRVLNNEILSPEILRSYQLNPNLLSDSEISEFHRAKMRLWIAENCQIRKLSYRTASLACYILDLYFSKGNKCRLEQFHEFGICCLRIANKMEDNFLIPINYDIFNKERLTQIETSICMKTNFCLNPITFTELSHSLYHFWNLFKAEIRQSEDKSSVGFLKELKLQEKARIVQLEFSFVLLHEFLETVFLILNSLKFGLDQLVSNAFFLIFSLQFENYPKILSSSKVLSLIRESQGPSHIWRLFDTFYHEIDNKCKIGINEECLHFLYPIYNCLITEGQSFKPPKDKEFSFTPNQENLRLSEGCFDQTLHFKNKMNSFKRYAKRQGEEKLRKCSEVTHA